MGKALLLICVGSLLAGCAASHRQTPEQEASVRVGEEERGAMLQAIGSLDPHDGEVFLEHYPHSQYRWRVATHMDALARLKQEEEENRARAVDPDEEFARYRQQDTIPAYQEYLYHHHQSDKHYAEALARLDELLHASASRSTSEIIITAGPLSQPYTALGEVDVNTKGMVNLGSILNDTLFRSPLQRAIQGPTPTAHTDTINKMLGEKAREQYGYQVDAVVNVVYSTDPDGDVFASGLAVHFVESHPIPAPEPPKGPNLEERLKELRRLREQNLITPEEYYDKRSELLKGL